ncbi:hypothetical protein GCM10023075_81870 [Streptosporangium album]
MVSAGVYGGRACDQPIYLRESSSMALPTMTPERRANALVKSGKTSVAEVFGRSGEDMGSEEHRNRIVR